MSDTKYKVYRADIGDGERSRVVLVADFEAAIAAAHAQRDEWKVMACEYSDCLQELCMKRLYNICRPASHAWPGMKHVGSIRMAVEFLIDRAEKAEAERAAVCIVNDTLSATIDELRERVARLVELVTLMQQRAHEGFDAWDMDKNMRAGKFLKALAGLSPGYWPDMDALRTALEGK